MQSTFTQEETMAHAYQPDATPQVSMINAIIILHAIKLYVNTGMKANRAYTPKMMRDWVTYNVSGVRYLRGEQGLRNAYAALAAAVGKPTTF